METQVAPAVMPAIELVERVDFWAEVGRGVVVGVGADVMEPEVEAGLVVDEDPLEVGGWICVTVLVEEVELGR